MEKCVLQSDPNADQMMANRMGPWDLEPWPVMTRHDPSWPVMTRHDLSCDHKCSISSEAMRGLWGHGVGAAVYTPMVQNDSCALGVKIRNRMNLTANILVQRSLSSSGSSKGTKRHPNHQVSREVALLETLPYHSWQKEDCSQLQLQKVAQMAATDINKIGSSQNMWFCLKLLKFTTQHWSSKSQLIIFGPIHLLLACGTKAKSRESLAVYHFKL